MKPLIYLASPYWHEDEIVRLARATQTRQKTAQLLVAGNVVYSPIVHNESLVKFLPEGLRHDHDFWMGIDLPVLQRCDQLWIYMLDGWKESRGVQREIEFAKQADKTLNYIT